MRQPHTTYSTPVLRPVGGGRQAVLTNTARLDGAVAFESDGLPLIPQKSYLGQLLKLIP